MLLDRQVDGRSLVALAARESATKRRKPYALQDAYVIGTSGTSTWSRTAAMHRGTSAASCARARSTRA
jgi:hypothetical protein